MLKHLSPSTVNSYRTCGRQVYFNKFLGIPNTTSYAATIYGSCVHNAIEKYLTSCIDKKPISDTEMLTLFDQEFLEKHKEITVWGQDTYEHMLEQGHLALLDFRRKVGGTIVPVAVEKEFMIDRGEDKLPIKCFADCITAEEVWDWKLGRGMWGTANSIDYSLNMATYALGFKQEYGRYPQRICIARVKWTSKTVNGKKKYSHGEWQVDKIKIPEEVIPHYLKIYDDVEIGIKNQVFLPIHGGLGLCKNCSYRGKQCDIHMTEVERNV